MPRLALIALLLSGISVGYAAATAQLRLDLAAGPPGWRHVATLRPGQDAGLSGRALPLALGYPLGTHGTLVPPPGGTALEVVATLPDDASLELRGKGTGAGVALVISNVGDGSVVVLEAGSGEAGSSPRAALACSGTLAAASLAGRGNAAVQARVALVDSGVRVEVDGEQATCTTTLANPQWSVRAGLRTLGLARLAVDGGPQVQAPGARWSSRLGGALLGLGLALGLARMGRGRPVLLAAASSCWPLWLCAPLAHADLGRFFVAWRLKVAHPPQWAVLGPVLLSLGLLGGSLAARWLRAGSGLAPGRAAAVAVGAALGWGGVAWALGPRDPRAAAFVGGIGATLGLVTWANARRVRGFNLLSLGGVALALLLAEHALSRTHWGASLVGVSNRGPGQGDARSVGTLFDTFEALENTRRFSEYPARDYPVRPPARAAPTRVVALGSSSTAGAYQNDDLDEFWPAELQRLLGSAVQVVNQGVGGWTSLHARRYLETQLELVDPDVVVVYLGHNDVLTPSPRTYADLLAAWRRGGDAALGASNRLGRVRVYQALRFGVQALVGGPSGVAVPVPDARDNYAAMAELLASRQGKLLLVREAISPDPSALAAYGEMMAALADSPGVAYLDAAPVLVDPRAGDAFLDDCHLTHHGHVLLAEAVAARLRDEGWIP